MWLKDRLTGARYDAVMWPEGRPERTPVKVGDRKDVRLDVKPDRAAAGFEEWQMDRWQRDHRLMQVTGVAGVTLLLVLIFVVAIMVAM